MKKACLIFYFSSIAFIASVFGLPRFPNILGRGYNIMKGNPLTNQHDQGFVNMQNPFQFKYQKSKTTEDGRFQIPDASQTLKLSDCSFQQQYNQFSSMQQYTQQIKKHIKIQAGAQFYFTKAAFTLSVEFDSVSQNMKYHQAINNNLFVVCYIANIGLIADQNSSYTFSQNFIQNLEKSYQLNDWSQFISRYGTHFAKWVTFGGRYGQVYQFNTDRLSQMNSNGINIRGGIKASFFGSIDASYSQYNYQKRYVQTSNTMIRRNKYNIGGRMPTNFNVQNWQNSVLTDPQPVEYTLGLWSQVFKFAPTQFPSASVIKSFQTFLSTKYCSIVQCITPNNTKIPKYNYYVAQVRGNGCGTSDIHCNSRYDTTSFDKAALYRMTQLHARSGWLFDSHMFIFTNQLGDRRQIGDNTHDWNYQIVTPHSNIISQYHEWTNPDCHHGAHQTFIGKAIFRFGNGQQSAQFGTGSCGSWGWEWKNFPGETFVICGHYGTKAFPYSVGSLCWQDIGLLYCRYDRSIISSWEEVGNVPETIFSEQKKQINNKKNKVIHIKKEQDQILQK